MATRRTTRRSIALNGNENDLSNPATSTTAIPIQPANKPTGKPALGQAGRPKVGLSTKSANTNTTSTTSTTSLAALARKRPAFHDVTNGDKMKSKAGNLLIKKETSSVDVAAGRRKMRTRSSTGGVEEEDEEVKQEDEDEQDDNENEEDEEQSDDKMMLDHEEEEETVEPVKQQRGLARQFKPLRRTTASTSTTSTSTFQVASTSTSHSNLATGKPSTAAAAAQPRRALGVKRANVPSVNPSNRPLAGKPAVKGHAVKTSIASTGANAAIRQRREAAEQRAEAARKELEEARREEEEFHAHATKRLKSDYAGEEGEYEEEEEEAATWQKERDQELEGMENDALWGRFGRGKGRADEVEDWDDLDIGDEDDPLMVSSYVVEVYKYLRELELTTMPDPKYMDNQGEVTWKMRGILIDWLVEIHTKFRLLPETIFLATNIIDRFLSERTTSLIKFQLVGVTALFIAAKYEEVVCPAVANFLYMTDGGYDDEEMLKAERYILSMIDFNLSYPNPINFLRRISKADGYDIQSRTMAKYFMEISIVDHKFLSVEPSLIAAAGNWLARKVLNKGPWDANLVHYSGYTEEEIKPTAQLMLDYVIRSSNLAGLYTPHHHGHATASALNAKSSNPLHPGAANHLEPEHPNFMKKYAGKKFFKASVQVRRWAETEYAPIEFVDPETNKIKTEVVPAIL